MSKNGISKHYIQLTNALVDLWGVKLTAHDHLSMHFILNRTIRWDNTGELIPRRHVMKGVPNIDTGPAGLCYRQWRRCVRTLEAEGLIQVEIVKEGLVIEVIIQRLLKGPKG